MKIFDHHGKAVNLRQQDYLAEGGQAKLYVRKDKVFKLYHDFNQAVPAAKIDELQQLDRHNIIRPLAPIFNDKGRTIGFSMYRVANNPYALPRLFTNAFWQQSGLDINKVLHLVEELRQTITFIHSLGFLQVDGNEFNYLVSSDFRTLYFIDVDSFQTPSFPAQAIMASIKDYQQLGFNKTTDWFSFAIVAFQMMVGIHPFKGRHADYKAGDFAGRIKANLSVLNPAVGFPNSVRDFAIIPKTYLDWFTALFEHGERSEPPVVSKTQVLLTANKHTVQTSKEVNIKHLGHFPEAVKRIRYILGRQICLTQTTLFNGKHPHQLRDNVKGFILYEGQILFLGIEKQALVLWDSKTTIQYHTGLAAEQLFVFNNIAYVITGDQLIELRINRFAEKIRLSPGNSRNILANATHVLDGLLAQNVMGNWHLMIPASKGYMPIVAIDELKGYKIVEAKYENQLAVIKAATSKGDYSIFRLRFSTDFDQYDIEIQSDDEFVDPFNFTVLDSGVVVHIAKQGELELISNLPHKQNRRIINSDNLGPQMRLGNDGQSVIFFQNQDLYRMSLQ